MASYGDLQAPVRFVSHPLAIFMGPQFGTLILLDLERFVLLHGTFETKPYSTSITSKDYQIFIL